MEEDRRRWLDYKTVHLTMISKKPLVYFFVWWRLGPSCNMYDDLRGVGHFSLAPITWKSYSQKKKNGITILHKWNWFYFACRSSLFSFFSHALDYFFRILKGKHQLKFYVVVQYRHNDFWCWRHIPNFGLTNWTLLQPSAATTN